MTQSTEPRRLMQAVQELATELDKGRTFNWLSQANLLDAVAERMGEWIDALESVQEKAWEVGDHSSPSRLLASYQEAIRDIREIVGQPQPRRHHCTTCLDTGLTSAEGTRPEDGDMVACPNCEPQPQVKS